MHLKFLESTEDHGADDTSSIIQNGVSAPKTTVCKSPNGSVEYLEDSFNSYTDSCLNSTRMTSLEESELRPHDRIVSAPLGPNG